MPASMIHPMWGDLVVCDELDGSQHRQHTLERELCWGCDDRLILTCPACKVIVECCRECYLSHAYECAWPL